MAAAMVFLMVAEEAEVKTFLNTACAEMSVV